MVVTATAKSAPHSPKKKIRRMFSQLPKSFCFCFYTCFPQYNLRVTQLELLILACAMTIYNWFHNFLTCLSVSLFCNKKSFLLEYYCFESKPACFQFVSLYFQIAEFGVKIKWQACLPQSPPFEVHLPNGNRFHFLWFEKKKTFFFVDVFLKISDNLN